MTSEIKNEIKIGDMFICNHIASEEAVCMVKKVLPNGDIMVDLFISSRRSDTCDIEEMTVSPDKLKPYTLRSQNKKSD